MIFTVYFVRLPYFSSTVWSEFFILDRGKKQAKLLHNGNQEKASSSAVAKRPRDASCLSVVSFNSTKRRVESFIVSYVGYRFVTVCS